GPASTVAAIPIVTDGRVRATLTLGRTSDVRPFDAVEQQELEAVADVVGAVLGNVELRSELSESALRDPLTDLYNRTYLDAALDQLLALRRRMKSEDRRPMAVILFDLDGFRRFNEDHGREMGDQALHAVGGVVRQRFRVSDTMARIGGDGFLVVMDGASREDAAKAASDVRSRVRGLNLATSRGEAVRISVSAGCATFVEADPGAQAVIRTVEAALETARWSGKDAIVSI
nr:sensor domain-containing diguanylate cyclase [Chloroflexota bacterium]